MLLELRVTAVKQDFKARQVRLANRDPLENQAKRERMEEMVHREGVATQERKEHWYAF